MLLGTSPPFGQPDETRERHPSQLKTSVVARPWLRDPAANRHGRTRFVRTRTGSSQRAAEKSTPRPEVRLRPHASRGHVAPRRRHHRSRSPSRRPGPTCRRSGRQAIPIDEIAQGRRGSEPGTVGQAATTGSRRGPRCARPAGASVGAGGRGRRGRPGRRASVEQRPTGSDRIGVGAWDAQE